MSVKYNSLKSIIWPQLHANFSRRVLFVSKQSETLFVLTTNKKLSKMDENEKNNNPSSSIGNEISSTKSYGTNITNISVKVQRYPGIKSYLLIEHF